MLQFLLLISRHGKIRLSKWFNSYSQKDRVQILKEVALGS